MSPCNLEPGLDGTSKGYCSFQSKLGSLWFQGLSGSQRLVAPASPSRHFHQGRAHPSQSILNCASGPGSPALTPVPLLCSMGFPASRLQDSGLLITRNSTSHHPFHFWFCQHCSLPPCQSPCVHLFLIFHPHFLSCLLACTPAAYAP